MNPPLTATEWTTIVALLVVLAVMIWLIPSCGDPECTSAHSRHSVAQRAAEIERRHNTFHGPTQPDPLCALCASRKRDDDQP